MIVGESAILISVIIPVKNGDYWLERTFNAIKNQTLADVTEIIILDSGSTDNSLRIIEKFKVKVINISSASFNHGLTRNIGVQEAKGKYVVMTVQDAEAVDKYWLQNLLDGFEDESVAGVCGQQIVPHEININPIEWFRPQSPPGKIKYRFIAKDEFNHLDPCRKISVCGWDNVTAMYQRDLLIKFPFKKVAFAEDALWAKEILLAGYAIVYNSKAQVKHYHLGIYDFTLRRTFTIDYHSFIFFSYIPSIRFPGLLTALKDLRILLRENTVSLRAKLRWTYFNYRRRKAIHDAHLLFIKALKENRLEEEHLRICSFTPQAIKPEN